MFAVAASWQRHRHRAHGRGIGTELMAEAKAGRLWRRKAGQLSGRSYGIVGRNMSLTLEI